jgi:hypothetical protein
LYADSPLQEICDAILISYIIHLIFKCLVKYAESHSKKDRKTLYASIFYKLIRYNKKHNEIFSFFTRTLHKNWKKKNGRGY